MYVLTLHIVSLLWNSSFLSFSVAFEEKIPIITCFQQKRLNFVSCK